ncbi:MAG: DUF5808 domain-containing protein [Chitinophagaceae bacterium]
MNNNQKHTEETFEQWRKDPNNWKWGIFYYNKEDKRLLPPKRNKNLGWTINFANPFSIVLLVIFIFLIPLVFHFLLFKE